MNDTKIKVLLVEPEKYPKEIVIDDSLEAMQEVVGGDIEEYMPYDDDVAIICNEEQFKYPERFSKEVDGNIVAEPFKPKSKDYER